MPIEQAITVKGVGPVGAVSFNVDERGAMDGGNRFYTPYQHVNAPLLAGSLDGYVWICIEGVWQVAAVRALVSTAGGSGAQVDVKVCAGLTAPASGTTQLSAALVLTTTGPSRADGTLIATPTQIFPGDSIALDFGGTLTALVGVIAIQVKRVA